MTYQTVNPYTNELVTSYGFATDQEIDATIEKAHEAFLNWRTTGSGDRSKVLTRAAELLRADKRAFADVLTQEMGKITAEAEAEVELSAECLPAHRADAPAGIDPAGNAEQQLGAVCVGLPRRSDRAGPAPWPPRRSGRLQPDPLPAG